MTIKIAISLPDDLVEDARQAVAEGRATSVSAFIADAMQQRRRYDGLSELLAEMSAEAGPPTDEHRAWARNALGLD
jgi:Arc/MetJ-type ribon-helix-helix transcriptional regulator